MLKIVSGNKWVDQVNKMSEFDLKIAISLDNTDNSFA